MKYLTDFMALSQKAFWDEVFADPDGVSEKLAELWQKATEETLSQLEASECLNLLFLDSHQRIAEHSKALAKNYPTRQYTKNRLENRQELWWTDHFTAGISRWSTLNWFSAAKRKKKSGKMGYAGASTHFIQGYHGLPFYIIPLRHGAWHEPRRNKDSISIEFVNAGMLKHKDGQWSYWARALPEALIRELPPVLLDTPYRGIKIMQPFTRTQLVNGVVLKRVVIAALGQSLELSRMSQHSDWRDGKTDMGPLWPFEDCNDAAFGQLPVLEYDFIQDHDYEEHLDEVGALWDEISGWDDEDELQDNPEFGEETPTHDDDPDDDTQTLLTIKQIQQSLTRVLIPTVADGRMGPKTRANLKLFQRRWNNTADPKNQLKVDGIPGPRTCSALKRS